jgi:two-component system OmpR family response regulator
MAKILVIEDNAALNEAYQIILTSEGHRVTVAHHGQEGLDKLKRFSPDLILLDLLMPTLDGIGFLKQYRKLYPKSGTKIVVLTNLDQDKQITAALKLGAYKYIVKARTSPKQLAVNVNHLVSHNIEKKDAPPPPSALG